MLMRNTPKAKPRRKPLWVYPNCPDCGRARLAVRDEVYCVRCDKQTLCKLLREAAKRREARR